MSKNTAPGGTFGAENVDGWGGVYGDLSHSIVNAVDRRTALGRKMRKNNASVEKEALFFEKTACN